MRSTTLLAMTAAATAVTSVTALAAKRNCPDTRCFEAINECGVNYGSCWDECALDISTLPTFKKPFCPPTASPLAEISARPTTISSVVGVDALITAAPVPRMLQRPTEDDGCVPMSICVDAVAKCGNAMVKYGGCYDTCTPKSLTPPPCTLASELEPQSTTTIESTTTITPPASTLGSEANVPKLRKPCRAPAGKEWMCAPAGW